MDIDDGKCVVFIRQIKIIEGLSNYYSTINQHFPIMKKNIQ